MQWLWRGLHSQRRTRCWENYFWWWNSKWMQGNQNIRFIPMFFGVVWTLYYYGCPLLHAIKKCPHFCIWPNSGNYPKWLNWSKFPIAFRIWILRRRGPSLEAFFDWTVLIHGCFTHSTRVVSILNALTLVLNGFVFAG